ncbi:hypothetical protein VP01_3380g1 [Puccinia sorghi]|uniref:Uncharacterized protein n=1 Tax=Puccinia sorghi TaxID=27349 RepID=A0A0L6UWQ2_9BASI|nr:hypothetical protein VP01_3380g1 [Puccinia sorghi]
MLELNIQCSMMVKNDTIMASFDLRMVKYSRKFYIFTHNLTVSNLVNILLLLLLPHLSLPLFLINYFFPHTILSPIIISSINTGPTLLMLAGADQHSAKLLAANGFCHSSASIASVELTPFFFYTVIVLVFSVDSTQVLHRDDAFQWVNVLFSVGFCWMWFTSTVWGFYKQRDGSRSQKQLLLLMEWCTRKAEQAKVNKGKNKIKVVAEERSGYRRGGWFWLERASKEDQVDKSCSRGRFKGKPGWRRVDTQSPTETVFLSTALQGKTRAAESCAVGGLRSEADAGAVEFGQCCREWKLAWTWGCGNLMGVGVGDACGGSCEGAESWRDLSIHLPHRKEKKSRFFGRESRVKIQKSLKAKHSQYLSGLQCAKGGNKGVFVIRFREEYSPI